MIYINIIPKSTWKFTATMVKAHQKDLDANFSPAWGGLGVSLQATAKPKPGAWRCELVDIDPDSVQGALGYHTVLSDNTVLLRVMPKLCLKDGVDPNIVISHELKESALDPYVFSIALHDNRNGTGTLYAAEVGDPCQDQSYSVNGVLMSNFVLPAWFIDGDPGPYDHLGSLKAPFTRTAGGYFETMDIKMAGQWVAQGADRFAGSRSLH